jgi:hypothetical protein
MLNRTFRTLSANFDRLNLGTRSLAAHASVFNVVAPRTLLDDRQKRMDFPRTGFGMITGTDPQGYPGLIVTGSGSPPTGHAIPWMTWTSPRVEVVADQPTPAGEVVHPDVRRRRRRRPVRTVRAATASASRPESSGSRAGAERLTASAATNRPSPARSARCAAGG